MSPLRQERAAALFYQFLCLSLGVLLTFVLVKIYTPMFALISRLYAGNQASSGLLEAVDSSSLYVNGLLAIIAAVFFLAFFDLCQDRQNKS